MIAHVKQLLMLRQRCFEDSKLLFELLFLFHLAFELRLVLSM